jgi:hypothetical protein
MFGHDDDHDTTNNLPSMVPDNASVPAPLNADPLGNVGGILDDTTSNFVATPEPGNDVQPAITPTGNATIPAVDAAPTLVSTPAPAHNSDELMNLKQQALQQLSPLMDQLDQTPEERFRTTMMMIQASDNDGLIKNAYDAALAIPDEKARAQALLDVINEINYFTQQDSGSSTATA